MARRNWFILAALTAGSLFWHSRRLTLGVVGGGLVAILGYQWLQRSLVRILEQANPHAARSFQFGYVARLASLAAALYLLIAVLRVHPVGLVVGLSVVLLNIGYTTIKRLF